MKSLSQLLVSVIALGAAIGAYAAKPIPGPKGGRVVTTTAPHVEFFVAPDRTVVVSFYDQNLKSVPPAIQVVNAIAEAKSGKVKLEFARNGDALISNAPLPPGDDYTVVLQVRDQPGAKPTNYRVLFHDEACGECKLPEYACVCDGHGGAESAH